MFDSIVMIKPRKVGWGGGIQGHIAVSTVNATTDVGGGGKFIEELDRAANGY